MDDREIEHLGLVGGGLMGAGIAQSALLANLKVTLYDISDAALLSTRSQIEDGPYGLERGLELGMFSRTEVDRARERFQCSTSMESLSDCDLVIESVPERLELKQEVHAQLETHARDDAILASNTSGFAICDVAARVANKSRMIGLHWFAPANITTGVELIHHPAVTRSVIQRASRFCAHLGKVAFLVKDKPGSYGFACNRVYLAMVSEALKVVEEGVVSAEDLNDLFKRSYGWPAGPIEHGYPFSKEGIEEVAWLRAKQAGW